MTERADSVATARLTSMFDRVAGLHHHDAAMRVDLIDTAILRPLGILTASAGFLLMSVAAATLTGRGWAIAWLAFDTMLLLARLVPTVRAAKSGKRMPDGVARGVLCVAFMMFAAFGAGCAASFLTGLEALRITSAVAAMGLLAGLATRWAALPRFALAMTVIVTVPMTASIATVSPLAAALFAVVGTGSIVLTMQNNRTLVAMLTAERQARLLSTTDALTGALNRHGLEASFAQLADRGIDEVAVLYLDLDRFKQVNDRWGHSAGDRVLAEIARRLRDLAPTAPIARLGGDEFAVVLIDSAPARIEALVQSMMLVTGLPIAILDGLGTMVEVGVSQGMAHGSLRQDGYQRLLERADQRLYVTKGLGREALPPAAPAQAVRSLPLQAPAQPFRPLTSTPGLAF